jgi:2-polyprenyl-3-methyl-5-hydroxy-6-metoxy-1,4-benzoquinol methylase
MSTPPNAPASTDAPAAPPPAAALQGTLMQLINGKHVSRCVSLVADLGITNLLADGPVPVDALAARTDSHAPALDRVLRLLTRLGAYAEVQPGVYANTPLSELLGDDHPHSVRDYARWMGTGLHWNIVRDLDFSVATGTPSILKGADTDDIWPVLASHPAEQQVFQDAMTGMSKADGQALAEAYDWTPFGRIVDAGGGEGTLARLIAERAPDAHVTVFDLPHVIEQTREHVAATGLPNLDAQAGSFFESVPAGADLVVMKYIIHDWDDERAVAILETCRAALNDGGKVVLCEMVITDGPESIPAHIFDIEMLLGPGGRERSRAQFAALFERAGFRLTRILDTASALKIVEAEVAS